MQATPSPAPLTSPKAGHSDAPGHAGLLVVLHQRWTVNRKGGRNLYTLNGQSDTIGVFKVKDKGGLARLNSHIDVPASANGLAVR